MGNIESKMDSYFSNHSMPKKRRLGPQNSSESLGPQKLPKILNHATIKETGKIKEKMLGVHVE